MSEPDGTRREFLRLGGALLSMGVASSSAGCLGSVDVGGLSGTSVGWDWMYEPGDAMDRDHYSFRYFRPKDLEEAEDDMDSALFDQFESFESRIQYTDVDFDEVDEVLAFPPTSVVRAEFDEENVLDELEDNDFDDETETNGYQIWEHDSGSVGVAVGNGLLLTARTTASEDPEELLEMLVETNAGDNNRYVEDVDAFSELADQLNLQTAARGASQEPSTGGGDGDWISPGQTIEGRLESSDDTDVNEITWGAYVDQYKFHGEEGATVGISMSASDSDAMVGLEGPEGSMVAWDDDSGEGYNSRLEYELQQTGVFTVLATSYGAEQTFDYELTLSADGGVSGAAAQLENVVAIGNEFQIDGDETSRRWVVVFDDEGDVDTGGVEDWVDEGSQFEAYDDISIDDAGRSAIVEGVADTDEVTTL